MSMDFHQGFLNNMIMGLPIYVNFNINEATINEFKSNLRNDLNLHHPVVLNIKQLNLKAQEDFVRYVEDFYISNAVSMSFPYPIYLIADTEVTTLKLTVKNSIKDLPRFFNPRDNKMNVRESHIIDKNKLLQQEIRNSDISFTEEEIEHYSESHKKIFKLESEINFYQKVLDHLIRKSGNE